MNKSDFLILIVDDEKDFLASMEFWFKTQGYSVAIATGGEEALAFLKTRTPSVVFLDYMMPGMSGVELLAAIRKIHPHLPAVMLTAHGEEQTRVEAFKYGINGVFDKSLDFYKAEHILNSLVRVVARSRGKGSAESNRWIGSAVAVLVAGISFGLWVVLFATPQVCFGPHCVAVEIAQTEAQRAHGLMDRSHLSFDRGMLFVFPREDFWHFWMKDTYIPLDIIWIDGTGRVVEVIKNAKPAPGVLTPPSFGGTFAARYVLEVNAGFAQQYGIENGTRAIFKWIFPQKRLR